MSDTPTVTIAAFEKQPWWSLTKPSQTEIPMTAISHVTDVASSAPQIHVLGRKQPYILDHSGNHKTLESQFEAAGITIAKISTPVAEDFQQIISTIVVPSAVNYIFSSIDYKVTSKLHMQGGKAIPGDAHLIFPVTKILNPELINVPFFNTPHDAYVVPSKVTSIDVISSAPLKECMKVDWECVTSDTHSPAVDRNKFTAIHGPWYQITFKDGTDILVPVTRNDEAGKIDSPKRSSNTARLYEKVQDSKRLGHFGPLTL